VKEKAMTPDLSDILDRCIERIRSGGDAEEILRANPQAAAEVRPLLALVSELKALPSVTPTPESMVKMMAAIVAQRAAEARPPRPRVRLFSLAVLARAAAVLVCVLLLGWGVSSASSNTMPGDWLYPVKLMTERARFFLTVNAEDRVELRIVFSDRRLMEAVRRQQQGQGIDKGLLTAMLDEAKTASEGSAALPTESRGVMVARVAYQAEFQRRTVERLRERASNAEQEQLTAYLERCSDQCSAACEMMGVMGGGIRCPICQRAAGNMDKEK
jgi:hypothetical protein